MTIYVPVGLPACGKTRLYRGLVRRYPDVSHISPDNHLFDQTGRYRGGRERRKAAWRQALQGARTAAAQGESFYFDATHITARSREQILEIASHNGHDCVAIWFQTPLEVCLQRNAQETGDRRVPDATMSAMYREMEPPTTGEGFDQVIKPSSTGEFTGQPPRTLPKQGGFMLA